MVAVSYIRTLNRYSTLHTSTIRERASDTERHFLIAPSRSQINRRAILPATAASRHPGVRPAAVAVAKFVRRQNPIKVRDLVKKAPPVIAS